jgi:hypothetical protein
MTAVTPFEHEVIPRLTEFRLPPEQIDTTIQEVYAALADDRARNELIVADLLRAVGNRRSPLLLTGRTNHLKYFEMALSRKSEQRVCAKRRHGQKTAPNDCGGYCGCSGERAKSHPGNWQLHWRGL